jgi:hypothetical protein
VNKNQLIIPLSLVSRLSFLLLFLSTTSASFAQHDWVLKKDADSIKVYTSHADESKFKSIRAVFTVNATLSQLAAMVWNVNRYDQWQYNTIHPKILKAINEKEMIYYAEIVAPWPVSNRDMIVRLSIEQNLKTKIVTIHSKSESAFVPEEDGIVRVPSSVAQWVVTPIHKSKLSIEYTIQIDPGGSVPAWMVNMVCAEAPHESFRKLREKIHDEKSKMPLIID